MLMRYPYTSRSESAWSQTPENSSQATSQFGVGCELMIKEHPITPAASSRNRTGFLPY
ncbi:hypothetical protein PAXRUDRAFT_828772 [Paxillus rubicundulus Ve08.2h10]|uniref:Uncharacterized protein n=1 Tax=Paxillus rubicundulus Ve08.2h10 TaxID=930991 RepID=A0A0D0D9D4_9AGAM|nr:hypothetical protein PAXRUDRAFT_828772 [Paxillus rubicundulus Ve08.2h10]